MSIKKRECPTPDNPRRSRPRIEDSASACEREPQQKVFRYGRLGPAQIRLISIHNDPGTDDIHCSMASYSSDQWTRPEVLKYAAISYTWGEPDNVKTIYINNRPHTVRYNCWAALRAVRHHGMARLYWIDAICINQRNVQERNRQVPLMRHIYTLAQCTLACAGLDDNTDATIDSVSRSGRRAEHSSWGLASSFEFRTALEKLHLLDYFHRLWVMLEVLLARHVYILGLTSLLDWQILRKRWAYTLRDHAYDSRYTILDSLLAYRPPPIYYEKNTPPSVHLAEQLLLLVAQYGSCECRLPHDKIYALLSLLSRGEQRSWCTVDYSRGYVDVLMDLLDDLGHVDVSVASPAMGRLLRDSRGWVLQQEDRVNFIKNRRFRSVHRMPESLCDQDTGSATGSVSWLRCVTPALMDKLPDVSIGGHLITFQMLASHNARPIEGCDYIVACVDIGDYNALLLCQARHPAQVRLERRAWLEQRPLRRAHKQGFIMYFDIVGQKISQERHEQPFSRCDQHDGRQGCACPELATWQSLRLHWRDLMALELSRHNPIDGDVQCPITTPDTRSYIYVSR